MQRGIHASASLYPISLLYFSENFKDARKKAGECVDLSKNSAYPGFARSLVNKAWLEMKLGEWGRALADLEDAKEFFRSSKDIYGELSSMWNMAKVHLILEKEHEFLKIAKIGLNMAKNRYIREIECRFLELLNSPSECWSALGKEKLMDFLRKRKIPTPAKPEEYFSMLGFYGNRGKMGPLFGEIMALRPQAVILRGSLSTGDYSIYSDADFTVLVDMSKKERYIEKMQKKWGFASVTLVNSDIFLGKTGEKKLLPAYICYHGIFLESTEEILKDALILVKYIEEKYGKGTFERFYMWEEPNRWRLL